MPSGASGRKSAVVTSSERWRRRQAIDARSIDRQAPALRGHAAVRIRNGNNAVRDLKGNFMSESLKYVSVAQEIHYLTQLACESGEIVKCSHFKHLIRSNHVTATPQIVGTAEQVIEEFVVPQGQTWLVTFAGVRSSADQANYPNANQELVSDSDLSPSVGAIVGNIQQLAQWRSNGKNKTPLARCQAIINSSYLLVFNAGEKAQLLVSAGVAAQRVELFTRINGYLVPAKIGALYLPFETQFMVEGI